MFYSVKLEQQRPLVCGGFDFFKLFLGEVTAVPHLVRGVSAGDKLALACHIALNNVRPAQKLGAVIGALYIKLCFRRFKVVYRLRVILTV